MNRKSLTLIELLIVVACSIRILAACEPTTGPSPEETIVASMKSDLVRLVAAQEEFWSDNNDYAGAITSGPQANGIGGAGRASFVPSQGNVVTVGYINSAGWRAIITNPALFINPSTCGIYTGPAANAPNAAVVREGAPGCW